MRSVWDTPSIACPYCGEQCNAEFVDIGVGMQQCEPYHCEACGAIEIGPTTTPDLPLLDDEQWTGWTYRKRTPFQKMIRTAFDGLVDSDFMDASDHRFRCKCEKCLQWWVTIGPEDTGAGWSFGPFSEVEFVAAGGIVPEYALDEADDNESPF